MDRITTSPPQAISQIQTALPPQTGSREDQLVECPGSLEDRLTKNGLPHDRCANNRGPLHNGTK
eukprot:12594223-Alexandrium_andersonii.AAC.1